MKLIYIITLLAISISCKQKPSSEILKPQNTETEVLKDVPLKKNDFSIKTAILENSQTYKMLQGTWANTLDPFSTLTFNENVVLNKYDGQEAKSKIYFTISDTCLHQENKKAPKEADKYISTSGDGAECYYIIKLNKDTLEMSFNGGNKPLTFKRI